MSLLLSDVCALLLDCSFKEDAIIQYVSGIIYLVPLLFQLIRLTDNVHDCHCVESTSTRLSSFMQQSEIGN